jgi:hypothetical protein
MAPWGEPHGQSFALLTFVGGTAGGADKAIIAGLSRMRCNELQSAAMSCRKEKK